MNKKSAFDMAVGKLNYRMRTEKEIRTALIGAEYEMPEIDETIEKLIEYGYINDENYIREFFKYSKGRNLSDKRILSELELKGINAALSREVIEDFRDSEEFQSDWEDASLALKIAEKMRKEQMALGKPIDRAFQAKVGRRLASLGYSQSICFDAIRKVSEKNDDGEI